MFLTGRTVITPNSGCLPMGIEPLLGCLHRRKVGLNPKIQGRDGVL